MPAKKTAANKSAPKKPTKSFEETLWDTANKLRGSVESSDYKHVVLSLIFRKDQKNFDTIVSTAEGSAQPNISSSGIESVECPVPPKGTLSLYKNTASSLFEKWISNHNKSKTLTKLRNTLLPKLISGELQIQDAETFKEEVMA